MAKLLKLRRGSTSQHSSFTGAEGVVTVDTDKDVLVVNDGSTAGGHPLAAEDMSNVSSASIAGRLATDSIATTKIAAGALPTDVTVASANIVNGTIVNEDVNASAAIAGTKVSPDFGSQNTTTTGIAAVGELQVTSTAPKILLTDSDSNPDFEIRNLNGSCQSPISSDATICNKDELTLKGTVASKDGSQIIRGSLNIDEIYIGVNSVDYSGYPDCRKEFIDRFENLVNISTKKGLEGKKFKIMTPLINLSKKEIILMLKGTSLEITVTLMDLTGVAKYIISTTFKPVEVFIVAGSIYLFLTFLIHNFIKFAEKKMGTN